MFKIVGGTEFSKHDVRVLRVRCLWENHCSFPLGFPVSSLSFSSLYMPSFSSLLFLLSPLPPPILLRRLSKTIKVKVIDDEEYEKNKTFYIEIGEPRLVESNITKGQERAEPCDPVSPMSATVPAEATCSRGGTQEDILSYLLRFLLMCP